MGCISSHYALYGQRGPSLAGYSFQEPLGAGSFGQVRACTEQATNRHVAVKIVHLSHKKRKYDTKAPVHVETVSSMAQREAALWEKCSGHKHILTLFNSFITSDFAFFIMDRCECSLMDSLIMQVDGDVDIVSYYRQMLTSIEFVHSKYIIHRDIKHANFLIKDRHASPQIVQLCDFGLAIPCSAWATSKPAGSRLFMAPEMMRGGYYDCGVDIWSLGVTIYVITFGDFPYIVPDCGDFRDLDFSIKNNSPPPSFAAELDFPKPSLAMVAFVKQLLEHDPQRRKPARQCLKMQPVAMKRSKSAWELLSKGMTSTSSLRTTSSKASLLSSSSRSRILTAFSRKSSAASLISMPSSLPAEPSKSLSRNGTTASGSSNTSFNSMAAIYVELKKKARDLEDAKLDQEVQNDIDDAVKLMDPSAPSLRGETSDVGTEDTHTGPYVSENSAGKLPTLGPMISENSAGKQSNEPLKEAAPGPTLLDSDGIGLEGFPTLQPLLLSTHWKAKAASAPRRV